METFRREKENRKNRGSALILVIVCMVFAGILGTSVLAASITNRDMKLVDERAKENFYETESGIDIFIANLQKLAEDTLGEEYSRALTHYGAYGGDAASAVKLSVRDSLAEKLTGVELSPGLSAEIDGRFMTDAAEDGLFYGVAGFGTDYELLSGSEGIPAVQVELDGEDLCLRGLSVSYKENGYQTKITTDIRVAVAFSRLDVERPAAVGGNYKGYAILADGNIRNHLTASSIRGNVYAGKSLTAEDYGLSLNADILIVGDALETRKSGSLDIGSGKLGKIAVWAGSIATVDGSSGQSIRISRAECHVEDDLTIGADSSYVKIDGEYYGYHSVAGASVPSEGSAVTINAGRSTLDLSGLDMLWLAGRSVLAVPSLYGASSGTVSYTEILEGEAVSYRGNQLAYLMPEECIREYGHNPLTKEEYDEIIEEKGSIAAVIDTEKMFGAQSSMSLAPYVNPTSPCTVVPVRFMNEPEPLYYIYLKFRTASAAENYFLAFSEAFAGEMKQFSDILELGDVLLPAASEKIKTNGTVIRVQDHAISEVIAGTIDNAEAMLRQSDYARRFSGLKRALDEQYIGAQGEGAVRNLLRMSELEKISGTQVYYFNSAFEKCSAEDAAYQVRIANENVRLESENISGIVIANGDVELSGVNFCGMLLATGNVTLRDVDAAADTDENTDFVTDLLDKNPEISKFFKNYPLLAARPGEETAVARNISITLENWVRN